MIKGAISFLLIVFTLTMRINDNDQFRNKTIVKIMAAYSNKCIQENQQTGEYEYNPQVSFVRCFREFLRFYLTSPFTPDTSKSQKVQQAFINHRKEVTAFQQRIKSSKEDIPEAEQNQLASEFLGKLDTLFPQVYNFTSNNPDKYLSLIFPVLPVYGLDQNLVKLRRVYGQKSIRELPETFQYFFERKRRNTSQTQQDGVIEAIFDLIKANNKIFVEVGGGSKQDNTYYLRTYKGWKGYLLNSGRYFMGQDKDNKQYLIDVMVTPGNVLQIFRESKVPRELDFLSVDIDGNDYWVTKELLKEYRPAAISVEFNPNFPWDIAATIKNCQPNFLWNQSKIFGVSARAIYDLARAHGYSYIFHHSGTDIFFVRSQLLPPKFRGMRLEDTFDALPHMKLDLNMPMMSAKDLWQQGQEDCEESLSKNATQLCAKEDLERQVSEQVKKAMREQAKILEKQRTDGAKAEGLQSAERVGQQIKFNIEVRKELDEDKLRHAQVAKQLEELRGECEKAVNQTGQWSPGWVLLAGVVIGMLMNLAFSAAWRCCKRRQYSRQMGIYQHQSSQVFQQTE